MEEVSTQAQPATSPVEYAGFWRRFAAYVIDGALLNIVSLPFVIIFLRYSGVLDFIEISRNMPPGMAALLSQSNAISYAALVQNIVLEIMYFAVWQGVFILLYFAFWESSRFKATPGKIATRIQVTRVNGEQLTFLRALARNLSKVISGMILMVGYMLAGWTEKKQALHDLITDSVVTLDETSDDPSIHPQYAGFWRRFVAWFLDMVLLAIVIAPIRYIFMPASIRKVFSENFMRHRHMEDMPQLPSVGDMITLSVLIVLMYLITYLYYALWESSQQQGTPGKLALGIKVTDVHGQRLSFWRASARFINRYITNATFLIGYMMAGWTSHKQALHDKLGNCLVIKSNN